MKRVRRKRKPDKILTNVVMPSSKGSAIKRTCLPIQPVPEPGIDTLAVFSQPKGHNVPDLILEEGSTLQGDHLQQI